MPKEWEGLDFSLHYLNSLLKITISRDDSVLVKVLDGETLEVKVNGQIIKASRE